MNCKKCHSNNIIKYWTTKTTQRYLCHNCNSTFSIWWLKKDYNQTFIDWVMNEYCHQHKTAKQIISEHKISSRTLVNRKHKHEKTCKQCKK
jgi:transposase-like protein